MKSKFDFFESLQQNQTQDDTQKLQRYSQKQKLECQTSNTKKMNHQQELAKLEQCLLDNKFQNILSQEDQQTIYRIKQMIHSLKKSFQTTKKICKQKINCVNIMLEQRKQFLKNFQTNLQ